MNTRKQIKRKHQAQAQRRNRLLVISGIVLLALVVVVILITQTPKPSNTAAIVVPTKQAWPQSNGKSMGSPDAKVVVTEFADFQCPICDTFHTNIWPQLISQYVATGKVRFEYKHFIVIDGNVGGVESRHAAEASECASEQNMFWDYATTLLANQQAEGSGTFGDDRLKTMAANTGLDTAKFNACFDSHKDAQLVVADEGKATSIGLNSTPSLLVNGAQVKNPLDFAQVKAAIDTALQK
jgi:protein-disulfide isomerase